MPQQILMATRAGQEAEPVVIDTDDPQVVKLTLDDGETLEFDAAELRNTVDHPTAEAA